MPYYLAPYVGVGTTFDPFRPRGSDQPGWSAIKLVRPNGITEVGKCLLALPLANADAQLYLVAQDKAEIVPPAVRNQIRNRLGLTGLGQTRWQQIVEEILTLPPVGGWKPLRQTHDGWMRIRLGGLFSEWRPGSVGAALSDNFNRTAADLEGSTASGGGVWDEFTTNQDLDTDGTSCRMTGSAADDCAAKLDSDLATDDHDVDATLAAWDPNSGFNVLGLIGRKDGTATFTCYGWHATYNFGSSSWYLREITAGSVTTLAEYVATPAANDTMRLRCDGSDISGWVNGVSQATASDPSITGNVRAGVWSRKGDSDANMRLDTWSAADLAAGGATWPGWMHSRGGWTA